MYYDYDSCGRLVRTTDQAGYTSEIIYDTAGNPVKVVLPEGVTESYTYDTNGNLLTVTDALGEVNRYRYDAYGRTTAITDAVGVTTEYQYDIAGNIIKNLFTGEEYCYNAYDEVVLYTGAEGDVTRVQYDAQGNVTSTVDALGGITSYIYRKDGLLTEIKDASGAVTLYEYNNKGLVSKETDALGAVTTYEYDAEDRMVKLSEPNGTVTEYTYNTDGSITRITAVKANGEAEELRYLYALDGSLTASISSSDILEYTYDERGYVETVTKNDKHTVGLVYDGNGNLTLLKELTSGKYAPDKITSYVYDSRGYLTEVYSGGTLAYKVSGYDRDGYSILSETAEGGELLASYISRADGLLEQATDGAGNVTEYRYNRQKQVIGLTITAADGSVLYRENNTYNKNGSLVAQSISGEGYDSENLTYTYDALDRLLSETKNGVTTGYTYDSMGNRLTRTENGVTTSYVYDLCNKLLSETTEGVETTYAYDDLGNLTAKTDSTGITTYAYDALNQLVEVVNPDGTWQRNTYDASGIRSMIAENGVTTEFMSFNGLVLGGYNKDGEQTEHYYYGNSLLTAEYTEYATDSYGEVTAETSLYYYLKNSHGDVIGLSDSNGTLTETYRYDAFGTLANIQSLNEHGVLAEAETALSRFLYAGEQYDSVSGLYYLRARYYDTTVGRFTQEDVNLGDGRNLYTYVSNNPLKYTDPSGYEKADSGESSGWATVKAAATLTATVVASVVIEELCPPAGIAMDVIDLTKAVADKDALGIAVGVIGFVPILGTVVKKGSKLLKHADTIAPAVTKVVKGVSNVVSPVLKKADTVVKQAVKKADDVVKKAATTVKSKASNFFKSAKSGASSLADKAKNALGSLFKKGKKTDDAVEAVQKVHGNSKASTKPQHGYEIYNKETGDVVKTGISGQKLNTDGSSPRANSQVNKLNKTYGEGSYAANVVIENIPNRAEALEWEKSHALELWEDGNSMLIHKRPAPWR